MLLTRPLRMQAVKQAVSQSGRAFGAAALPREEVYKIAKEVHATVRSQILISKTFF